MPPVFDVMSFLGRRLYRCRRRGVSPIIAVILLVAITLVLTAVLYAMLHVSLPPQYPTATFQTEWDDTSVELLGDGDNAPGTGGQCPATTDDICLITGSEWVLTQASAGIPISQLEIYFDCNGTLALSAPMSSISYAAAIAAGGAGDGHAPTSNSLCGGHVIPNYCAYPNGTWVPTGGPGGPGGPGPTTCTSSELNCFGSVGVGIDLASLVYYTPPPGPSSQFLQAGTVFTTYSGGYCMSAAIDSSIGDDYYGPPSWCNYDVGACSLVLAYTGTPSTILGTFEFAPGEY